MEVSSLGGFAGRRSLVLAIAGQLIEF